MFGYVTVITQDLRILNPNLSYSLRRVGHFGDVVLSDSGRHLWDPLQDTLVNSDGEDGNSSLGEIFVGTRVVRVRTLGRLMTGGVGL